MRSVFNPYHRTGYIADMGRNLRSLVSFLSALVDTDFNSNNKK